MFHTTITRTLDWRTDPRAQVLLASIAANPPRLAHHRHIYVLTRDDWTTYEGYRVDCLNFIADECLQAAWDAGTDAALDDYAAAPSVQDHVAAVVAAAQPQPTACAQTREARMLNAIREMTA